MTSCFQLRNAVDDSSDGSSQSSADSDAESGSESENELPRSVTRPPLGGRHFPNDDRYQDIAQIHSKVY